MRIDPATKYQPFEPVSLPERRWPAAIISKPPTWCSVDLRDGNQALADPMEQTRKDRLFDALVATGFKEIEVAFPSASRTEYDFVRSLIVNKRIPNDVTIQVLTPARDEHIERAIESLRGCRRAIMHLYNSTSTIQRRVVFKSDQKGIRALAVKAAQRIAALARETDTEIVLEYTPESFTGTELDFAKDICEAVMEVYQPSAERKIILNLPATVELATPNVYADQIEWFANNLDGREAALLSIHPHNDRGTAVAAAELALMAGADRIEGTLFGNGERTGNVDLVTVALNMFTQGIQPGLDFSDIKRLADVAQECTRMPIHPRHPYAGELVFAAFSGSHQDAIKKGLVAQAESNSGRWDVPYLPIDPADVGRQYEPVIRINSQSGKGGIAFVLEQAYGLSLPPGLQVEFANVVQAHSDLSSNELLPGQVWSIFEKEYLADTRLRLFNSYSVNQKTPFKVGLKATVSFNDKKEILNGIGSGPVDAYCNALKQVVDIDFTIVDFQQKSRRGGAEAEAVAYVQLHSGCQTFYGVGIHEDIVLASLQAVTSALNRIYRAASSQKGF